MEQVSMDTLRRHFCEEVISAAEELVEDHDFRQFVSGAAELLERVELELQKDGKEGEPNGRYL